MQCDDAETSSESIAEHFAAQWRKIEKQFAKATAEKDAVLQSQAFPDKNSLTEAVRALQTSCLDVPDPACAEDDVDAAAQHAEQQAEDVEVDALLGQSSPTNDGNTDSLT